MEPSSSTDNPIVKAVWLATIYTVTAVLGFILLAFSVINLPETMFLRSPESSKIKTWLPQKDNIPPGLILIDEYRTTNKDVAKSYAEPDDVLRKLEIWGREEGYSNLYLARDRCTRTGPRSIRISIILHKDNAGSQQYLEWFGEEDRKQSVAYQKVDIGNGGYQIWQIQESECPGEAEKKFEINFRRNNALGVVAVTAEENHHRDDELAELAFQLANLLDERIQKETATH